VGALASRRQVGTGFSPVYYTHSGMLEVDERSLSRLGQDENRQGLQPLFIAVVVFACHRYAMAVSGFMVFTAYLWHA